jgi:hypothetical protein
MLRIVLRILGLAAPGLAVLLATVGEARADERRDARLIERVKTAERRAGMSVPILDAVVDFMQPRSKASSTATSPPAPQPPRHDAPAATPVPTPMPTATNDQPGADKQAAPPREGPGWLAVQAGFGVGTRHFSYVQRITPALRTYDLPAVPMASVSAVAYPLAFTGLPVIRDFGVTGGYARLFTFSSEDSSGTPVGSTWQSFEVGATQRIALSRALVTNVSVGYGENDFQFDQALSGATALLPSADYRFVRAGADVRYEFLQAFAVLAGGSYLDVLGTGYLTTLFPRASVGGVEGHVGGSVALARSWELSLGASYTRFFLSGNSVPGDATVAGGALDEQLRFLGALSYRM